MAHVERSCDSAGFAKVVNHPAWAQPEAQDADRPGLVTADEGLRSVSRSSTTDLKSKTRDGRWEIPDREGREVVPA